ncbi:hypothetical protein [Kaistella palustris]|uniref:hypothetical protein n=1 Tax=Kaistella palustris TaxID=493376 RepID=UPI0003FC9F63|nr:hypothetical protein [Kaistella palustris]
MKNIFILLFLPAASALFAQVGINTTAPDQSAALDVFATNKGVSLPLIALSSKTDVATVPGPQESLLVYNTNDALIGKKGIYFWDGAMWNYFFNDLNQISLLNQTVYYSANSSAAETFSRSPSNQFYGYSAHAAGEPLSAQWTVLGGLTKTITVDRAVNDVLMNANGMFQANNTSSQNTSGVATTVGFFVDDKLVDVKPLFLDFQSPCSYRQFATYGIAKNLSTGTHTVKFAIRNISSPAISTLTVTYGGPNPGCSPATISSFEAAFSSTIIINQPYAF